MAVTTTPPKGAHRHNIARVLRGLRIVLDTLPSEKVEYLATRVEALVPPGQETGEGAEPDDVETEIAGALEAFATRERLLAGALTAPAVARLLGVSRQTPHDRVKGGALLAVFDRGAWRFPAWQFDADAPEGVLPGLPETLHALDGMPPLSKVSWFTSPKSLLPDTPLEMLRRGHPEEMREVVLAARTAAML